MRKFIIIALFSLISLSSVSYATQSQSRQLIAQWNEPGMNPQSADEDYDALLKEAGSPVEENIDLQQGQYPPSYPPR